MHPDNNDKLGLTLGQCMYVTLLALYWVRMLGKHLFAHRPYVGPMLASTLASTLADHIGPALAHTGTGKLDLL